MLSSNVSLCQCTLSLRPISYTTWNDNTSREDALSLSVCVGSDNLEGGGHRYHRDHDNDGHACMHACGQHHQMTTRTYLPHNYRKSSLDCASLTMSSWSWSWSCFLQQLDEAIEASQSSQGKLWNYNSRVSLIVSDEDAMNEAQSCLSLVGCVNPSRLGSAHTHRHTSHLPYFGEQHNAKRGCGG